ncbi:paeninodin family lasso peptide [Paenibacillus sp. NPDC058071]
MKKQWEAPALETLEVKFTFDGELAETQGRPKPSHWGPRS